MGHYVEVPSEVIESFLSGKRFVRGVQGSEVVYSFAHLRDAAVKVKVYTSIRVGATRARGCGEDAIRVVVCGERPGRSWGIAKLPRVYRTGNVDAVLARLHARMREAYTIATNYLTAQRA